MGSANELEILQGLCHAFGSALDEEEVYQNVVRWTRRVIEDADGGVRLFLSEGQGSLRLVIEDTTTSSAAPYHVLLQQILKGKKPARIELSHSHAAAVLPLVSRGDPVGILEVTAAASILDQRWETLEAVASQCAIALRNLRRFSELRQEVTIHNKVAYLATDLMKADTPHAAVRASVKFCYERLGLPAAGWIRRDDAARLELVGVRGFGNGKRQLVRTTIGTVAADQVRSEEQKAQIRTTFAQILDADASELIEAGPCVLMIAGALPSRALSLITSMLKEAVLHVSVVSLAHKRNQQLELGLAWTAHELRRPLTVSNVLLDALADAPERLFDDRDLLRRSLLELSQFSTLLDGLLRWSLGRASLSKQTTDLGAMVRELAESSDHEGKRILVRANGVAVTEVDRDSLRVALLNLLENALKYSSTQVEVLVAGDDDAATVSIRDSGPGITAKEREYIFDPFIRGQIGQKVARGTGLGLYIARRVVEAHGGALWVESHRKGVSFHVKIPASVAA